MNFPSKSARRFSLASIILIVAIIGLILTAVVPQARADVNTNSFGITNSIAAAAATSVNLGTAQFVGKQDNIGLQYRGQGNAAGNSNIVLYLCRSMDGTAATTETVTPIIWQFPANGTTAIVYNTNLTRDVFGPFPYIALGVATNGNASAAMTNSSLHLIRKTIKASP